MAELTENQKLILAGAAKLTVQVSSLFGTEVGSYEAEITAALQAAQLEQGTIKAAPLDIVATGLQLSKNIGIETGNQKVIATVDALVATADDAIAGKPIALIEDLVNDYHVIRADVKA